MIENFCRGLGLVFEDAYERFKRRNGEGRGQKSVVSWKTVQKKIILENIFDLKLLHQTSNEKNKKFQLFM